MLTQLYALPKTQQMAGTVTAGHTACELHPVKMVKSKSMLDGWGALGLRKGTWAGPPGTSAAVNCVDARL